MSLLEIPWEEVRKLLRVVAPEIGKLAARGDVFAKKVFDRYVYAYDHPSDKKANHELRVALDDYLKRDLMLVERLDLKAKFGHLDATEKDPGARIFVPDHIRKQ